MALPLGKLTILIGAGIIGSALAKEGRMSDIMSSAVKLVFKQIKEEGPKAKPRNDALMAQVNSLRQELQILASNKPITIITSSGGGSVKYTYVIVIVVVGYGYVWWKGWKLPDLVFATKRGLSDACNSVASQLENVYSSLSATKRELSSRIESVDQTMEEIAKVTSETEAQVSDLSLQMKDVGVDAKFIREKVQNMESKIYRIEKKQDLTNEGVMKLCNYARSMENGRTGQSIEASSSSSSRPAIEQSRTIRVSRTGSVTPLSLESSPSPSTTTNKGSLGSPGVNGASNNPGTSSDSHTPEDTRGGSSRLGRVFSVLTASVIPRSRSETQTMIQQLGRQTSGLGVVNQS